MNEVKLLRSLDHPNIISYYDSFVHHNKLCIVMEYAENGIIYNIYSWSKYNGIRGKIIIKKYRWIYSLVFDLYNIIDSCMACININSHLIFTLIENIT